MNKIPLLDAMFVPEAAARDLTRLRDNDDNTVHIVGSLQRWLDRLGLKVPRALCGVSLQGDPDRPDPGLNAPVCRRCAELESR